MKVSFCIEVQRCHYPEIGLARFEYSAHLMHLGTFIRSTDKKEFLDTLCRALSATENFVHQKER